MSFHMAEAERTKGKEKSFSLAAHGVHVSAHPAHSRLTHVIRTFRFPLKGSSADSLIVGAQNGKRSNAGRRMVEPRGRFDASESYRNRRQRRSL